MEEDLVGRENVLSFHGLGQGQSHLVEQCQLLFFFFGVYWSLSGSFIRSMAILTEVIRRLLYSNLSRSILVCFLETMTRKESIFIGTTFISIRWEEEDIRREISWSFLQFFFFFFFWFTREIFIIRIITLLLVVFLFISTSFSWFPWLITIEIVKKVDGLDTCFLRILCRLQPITCLLQVIIIHLTNEKPHR